MHPLLKKILDPPLRPMAGVGVGAFNCGSFEVAVVEVYVKGPISFFVLNMMSDWIHCFSFTEGFRGFFC